MRLKRVQQVSLIILGIAVFALGVTASAREWPAAGIVSLILPGLLITVFGCVGVFPNVHLKEGNVDWPKTEDPKPEEPKAIEPPADSQAREEIIQLRNDLAKVSKRLEDYILAHKPPPDDDMDDDDRLRDLAEAWEDYERDYSRRCYEGIGRTDGVDTDQVRVWRDKARDAYYEEEARQRAQYTFGLRSKPPVLDL